MQRDQSYLAKPESAELILQKAGLSVQIAVAIFQCWCRLAKKAAEAVTLVFFRRKCF
jgi:hypothetical protein